MTVNISAEISEISIEHDVHGVLNISIEQKKHNDQLKIKINDLVVNMDDNIAIELLHCLAEHYKYELIDLEGIQL